MATNSIERDVWSGTPSQIVNLKVYFICALTFWLIIPIFIAGWYWLKVRNTRFELTTERMRTREGVLNKSVDILELYRVKDLQIEHPFFLRLLGLGRVVLITSDKSHPIVVINAIADAEQLGDTLRDLVETMRRLKGVREFD